MKVEEIMSSNVKACRPETSLAEAVSTLWENDCGVSGMLIGMLSINDAVRAGNDGRDISHEEVRDAFKAICRHRTSGAAAG